MLETLRRLFCGTPAQRVAAAYPTLTFERDPTLAYAIGDVHGCLALLLELEALIFADAAALGPQAGETWIVMLGDYVDRGPDSAGVLDHLLRPLPAPFRRLMVAGNHEERMLDFLNAPGPDSDWLALGGGETLRSYGLSEDALFAARRSGQAALLDSHIPGEHRQLLETLPGMLVTPGYVFVHAGLRPGVPLDEQHPSDLMWIRDKFRNDYAEFGRLVVHGHTPTKIPLVSEHRINIDTGAYATGKLTAVRLWGTNRPQTLTVDARSGAA
jgi:serine/threonine protein phosphatase 1